MAEKWTAAMTTPDTGTDWSAEDEAQLNALTERKQRWATDRRRPLERLLEDVFYHNIGMDDLLRHLIDNADRYTAALATFVHIKE